MTYYTIFGGCLRSDQLPFPELPASSRRNPDWCLSVVNQPRGRVEGELLGACHFPGCEIALYRNETGFSLSHSCTGEFTISRDGSRIVWYPCENSLPEVARVDVLGRVLSVALHAGGSLPLHGSAVQFDTGVVTFIAPKRHGKSTLAAALVRAGARLVTDDTLAVDPGPPAMAHSGIHSMRLCTDSAERLIEARLRSSLGTDGKYVIDNRTAEEVMCGSQRLAAVYVLDSIGAASSAEPAVRTLLPPSTAVVPILTHSKIGGLLGRTEAHVLFGLAARLAATVPVYRLEVIRDLDCLDEVAEVISGWHTTRALVSAGIA